MPINLNDIHLFVKHAQRLCNDKIATIQPPYAIILSVMYGLYDTLTVYYKRVYAVKLENMNMTCYMGFQHK